MQLKNIFLRFKTQSKIFYDRTNCPILMTHHVVDIVWEYFRFPFMIVRRHSVIS